MAKRVNDLSNATLPLVSTDKILVSRDGLTINKATAADIPVSTAVQAAIAVKAELSTAQKANPSITGVAGADVNGNVYDTAGNKVQVTSPVTYDTVVLSASTTAVRSAPTLIAGFTCSASASGIITLYANTANSGTIIWSGAVTAGQIYTFPSPYQSYLGVSFQLVSGTATINLSVK